MAGSVVTIVKYKNFCLCLLLPGLLLAYSAKALCAESEMQSGSGCVLSDLALFFLRIF
jgi:hypothetical protein